jgi:hypothetical protein
MSVSRDITSIHSLVAKARVRMRVQGALEGATTGAILTVAAALAVVVAVRLGAIGDDTGLVLLWGSAGFALGAAAIGGLRPLDDERVARRIDRASSLADRLANAVAFERSLQAPQEWDGETREFMDAAIRDATANLGKADVAAATRFRAPRDLRAAVAFAVLGAVIAGVAVPQTDRSARVTAVQPASLPPGGEAQILGRHLFAGTDLAPEGQRRAEAARRTDRAPIGSPLPGNVRVTLTPSTTSRALAAEVLAWSSGGAWVRIPADAPLGAAVLRVAIAGKQVGELAITVVDPRDERFHPEDAATLSDDDLAYARALLDELRAVGRQDNAEAMGQFADRLEALLEKAERGELTKEKLLDELDQAQQALTEGDEPDPAQVAKDLADTGKALKKQPVTAELGKALEQGDLARAKAELEKLADKLDGGQLSEKQKQDLAKVLDQASEQFDSKQEERKHQVDQQMKKAADEERQLEKKRDQARSDGEREDAQRRLDKKRDELKKLEKQKRAQEQSQQREALERLHKDLKKTAEDLNQPPPDSDPDQQGQQQASRSLKDAARETGRVDQDQRKQAAQKKAASQMDDLREAMRRAKRKGSKGGQDPFGKSGKNRDFSARARGQKGQGQAWKPERKGGQPGKGQGQQPGSGGQNPGGQSWSNESDDNLVGDATGKSGDTQDEDVSGIHGKGPSRKQTILAAAQKGFASKAYEDVYTDYKKIVEEVMHNEKVPSSYRTYVRRYFDKIKPRH